MFLVDGNNWCWRAHHVSKGLSSNGKLTGVLHVGLSMLAGMHGLFEPRRVVFLWDTNPSWRVKVYPDYKGNRNTDKQDEREAVHAQMATIREVLHNLGVWQIAVPGHEADDLAGICVTGSRGKPITLISSDKDWFQLLEEGRVDQVRGWKGKNLDRVTAADVLKKHDVPVEQWAAYLALVGDPGDNIPNIRKGVGPVMAKKILAGKVDMTMSERLQYDRNLQLTMVLRKANGWTVAQVLDTGERSSSSFNKVERILHQYELYSVFQNRRALWEVGGWRS